MGRPCFFVDGGYFQKILEKDFQKPRIDFDRIGPLLSKQYDEFLRTYYYNCPPYQSASPSPAERRLISNADRFYYTLKNLNSFEVRLGRLAFRGIDRDSGEPIFQQKRVDVQLAVDLVTLAFSKQISTAIVVAGDSDFIPAFEVAKNQGVRVVLFSGRGNPAHRELISAADEHSVFDDRFIENVRCKL